MAMERKGMNTLREILRLKYQGGCSNRQVGKSFRISHRTVGKYWGLAQGQGWDWGKVQALSDEELAQGLSGEVSSPKCQIRRSKVIPDWQHIHEELKRPHVTLELLWQEYREQNAAGYQYSWFNELYGQWKKGLSICMKQSHKAGEKLFVDYCDGEGIGIIEQLSGKIMKTQLFVGVWGASNYTYAEASYGQEKQDWIMSHVRALEYFGCVPHIIIPDNLKSGVNQACKYEPEINRTYLELAQHYGFTVIPCRVARPKDKAKVEKGVNMAQRWILACLRNRKFYTLAEVNAGIRELLEKLNNRKMKKLDRTRQEMFEILDKPAALPLSLSGQRYEYADWEKCRVSIDYHIEVEEHYYSARYQLIHEVVDVRITERMIEIFYRGQRETSHIRSYAPWREHITNPAHMPEAHRQYLDQTPSKMIDWAGKVGPNTVEVIKKIFESRKYIQQSYRSCLGIRRLEGYYTRERLEQACRRAVRYQIYSYRSIKTILSGGLDKQPDLLNHLPEHISPAHENIRGEGYYVAGGIKPLGG